MELRGVNRSSGHRLVGSLPNVLADELLGVCGPADDGNFACR